MSQNLGCVFVDGENLRHSLVDLFNPDFSTADYLPAKAGWDDFYDWMAHSVNNSMRKRTYWYVVQHFDFFPYELPRHDYDRLYRVLRNYWKESPNFVIDLTAGILSKTASQRAAMQSNSEGLDQSNTISSPRN